MWWIFSSLFCFFFLFLLLFGEDRVYCDVRCTSVLGVDTEKGRFPAMQRVLIYFCHFWFYVRFMHISDLWEHVLSGSCASCVSWYIWREKGPGPRGIKACAKRFTVCYFVSSSPPLTLVLLVRRLRTTNSSDWSIPMSFLANPSPSTSIKPYILLHLIPIGLLTANRHHFFSDASS